MMQFKQLNNIFIRIYFLLNYEINDIKFKVIFINK
jgi:hypothetical protein